MALKWRCKSSTPGLAHIQFPCRLTGTSGDGATAVMIGPSASQPQRALFGLLHATTMCVYGDVTADVFCHFCRCHSYLFSQAESDLLLLRIVIVNDEHVRVISSFILNFDISSSVLSHSDFSRSSSTQMAPKKQKEAAKKAASSAAAAAEADDHISATHVRESFARIDNLMRSYLTISIHSSFVLRYAIAAEFV